MKTLENIQLTVKYNIKINIYNGNAIKIFVIPSNFDIKFNEIE